MNEERSQHSQELDDFLRDDISDPEFTSEADTYDPIDMIPFENIPEDSNITWVDALKGLNPIARPWRSVFWRSLASNMKDSALGLYQMPIVAYHLVKELRHLPGAAFSLENVNDKMPTWQALIDDYVSVYGSLNGLKEGLATDPVRVIADIAMFIPEPTSTAAGATVRGGKIAGKLGKVRHAGKLAKWIEQIADLPSAAGVKILEKGAIGIATKFKMDPFAVDTPLRIPTGKVDANGNRVFVKMTRKQLAEQIKAETGLDIDLKDFPIQILTDNEIPQVFQEVLERTEAEIAPKIAAEYDTATEAVKAAQRKQVSQFVSDFQEYWNSVDAGKFLQDVYEKWQQGKKTTIGKEFEKNDKIMERPVTKPEGVDVQIKRQWEQVPASKIAEWDADPNIYYRIGRADEDLMTHQSIEGTDTIGKDRAWFEEHAGTENLEDVDFLEQYDIANRLEELGVPDDIIEKIEAGEIDLEDYFDLPSWDEARGGFYFEGVSGVKTFQELQDTIREDLIQENKFDGNYKLYVFRGDSRGKNIQHDADVVTPSELIATYDAKALYPDTDFRTISDFDEKTPAGRFLKEANGSIDSAKQHAVSLQEEFVRYKTFWDRQGKRHVQEQNITLPPEVIDEFFTDVHGKRHEDPLTFEEKFGKSPEGIAEDIEDLARPIEAELIDIGAGIEIPAHAREYFPRVVKKIEELIQKDPATGDVLSDAQNAKIIEAAAQMLRNTLANPDELTLRKLDDARTIFGKNTDVFARQGEVLKTGEGSPTMGIYKAFSDDFLDILEKEVTLNPEAFPENFIDKVQQTRKEWRDLLILEDTNAAKWLRENKATPGKMLDQMLSKSNAIVGAEVDNLRRILEGSGEWGTFQKALLHRLFRKSMKGDEATAAGLKTQLANITETDERQLVRLFGEGTADMLHKIAEFREKVFGPHRGWNTPYAMRIIDTYLKDPDFTDIIFATGMMSDATAQTLYDISKKSKTFTGIDITETQLAMAINFVFAGFKYFPERAAKKKLVRGGYKDWMTEGYEYEFMFRGKKRKITAEHFVKLQQIINKYGHLFKHTTRAGARVYESEKERKQATTINPWRGLDTTPWQQEVQ